MDACASSDPDDANATLTFTWGCKRHVTVGNSTVASGCYTASATLMRTPHASSCLWSIGPSELPKGRYEFSVTATKADGESSTSTVMITQEEGLLPTLSIDALSAAKSNPSERLVLRGRAIVPPGATSLPAYRWSVAPPRLALGDAAVSSTGDARLNLVVRPHVLNAGATYTFTLSCTLDGRSAKATATVTMNRAPFGGELHLEFTPPVTALESMVEIEAHQWIDDDPSDLPITYSFAYAPSDLPRSEAMERASGLGQRSMATSITWRPPEVRYALAALLLYLWPSPSPSPLCFPSRTHAL